MLFSHHFYFAIKEIFKILNLVAVKLFVKVGRTYNHTYFLVLVKIQIHRTLQFHVSSWRAQGLAIPSLQFVVLSGNASVTDNFFLTFFLFYLGRKFAMSTTASRVGAVVLRAPLTKNFGWSARVGVTGFLRSIALSTLARHCGPTQESLFPPMVDKVNQSQSYVEQCLVTQPCQV